VQLAKLTFLGTSEEYAAVRHLFEDQPDSTSTRQNAAPSPRRRAGSKAEDILRVLRRAPLLPRHAQLLQLLYNKDEAYTSRSALANEMQLTPDQINGVLGSLGRRIGGTAELSFDKTERSPLNLFLDMTQESGEWHYRLQPEVRAALKNEGLV
jgi:predicted transcriptional regulator with HTH domain